MSDERVIAVGLLTGRDLKNLGEGFRRHYPVDSSEMFVDLLKELDRIDMATGPTPNRLAERPDDR